MYLDREQEKALSGELGPSREWAMRVLCHLGDDHKAARLVPVRSTHIPGWCTHDGSTLPFEISGAGPFLAYTTGNPGRTSDHLASNKMELERLGMRISYTCTPYLVGNHPDREEVVAWGGRAAVGFVNSIMGARSEMETYESALASAITGLTPERGLHLVENRKPGVAVMVSGKETKDLSMLGHHLSKIMQDEIPIICGIRPTFDEAKKLAFALNSHGAIPLFHLGLSNTLPPGLEKIGVDGQLLDRPDHQDLSPDLVILGCPHLSEQDINRWSKKLAGRSSSKAEAWFFTSRLCMDKCPVFGAVLGARGRVFVDRCPLGMKHELAGRNIACDSPELAECLNEAGLKAHYLPDHQLLSIMCRPI